MNKQPRRLKPGDIFWEKYNGKYFFGRVLLDLRPLQKFLEEEGKESEFYNGLYGDGYYVEVYKGIFDKPELINKEVLFIGFFSGSYLHRHYDFEGWEWYANEPVDIEKVEFPEIMFAAAEETNFIFIRGELMFYTTISKYNKHFWNNSGMSMTFVLFAILSIAEQGRVDLLKENDLNLKDYKINREDYRFNEAHRKMIYESIGEDPNMSYYELALKHGFDLKRLYKK